MTTLFHVRNAELFTAFYKMQGDLARCLSNHPDLIHAWLSTHLGDRMIPPNREEHQNPGGLRGLAPAPLELETILARSRFADADKTLLAEWLLKAFPFATYLESPAKRFPACMP